MSETDDEINTAYKEFGEEITPSLLKLIRQLNKQEYTPLRWRYAVRVLQDIAFSISLGNSTETKGILYAALSDYGNYEKVVRPRLLPLEDPKQEGNDLGDSQKADSSALETSQKGVERNE
jgi:hypothetical protein